MSVSEAGASRVVSEEAGVVSVPFSAFYAKDPVTSVVRLCFAKQDATLDAALERMVKRP